MNEENTSLQDITDDHSNICINISDKCFDKIPFSSDSREKKKRKFQEWFDNDCRKLRQEVNRKRKSYLDALRRKLTEH